MDSVKQLTRDVDKIKGIITAKSVKKLLGSRNMIKYTYFISIYLNIYIFNVPFKIYIEMYVPSLLLSGTHLVR